MKCQLHLRTVGVSLFLVIAFAATAKAEDIVSEIKAEQARFIEDINNREYEKVMAAFHPSYKGLVLETGFLTFDARKNMFRERFDSDDPGKIEILETEVRPLGGKYALLRSHIKQRYASGKSPADWWYTSIYIKSGGGWKVIHEQ